MPRRQRVAAGGYVFHVLNRAVARQKIFATQKDYAAFEKVMCVKRFNEGARSATKAVERMALESTQRPRVDGSPAIPLKPTTCCRYIARENAGTDAVFAMSCFL